MLKIDKIKDIVEKIQQKDSKEIELLSHFGRHYENGNSAVICDFLNVKIGEEYIFLKAFIEKFLKNQIDLKNKTPEITTEYPTITEIEGVQRYGRIDIFVKIDNDTCIIIENKIHAYDQQYQLQRYIQDISKRFNNVYVVYLTLDGSPPSEYSISKDELSKLGDKFSAISYRGILEWLKCVNVPKEHELLYSAFVQYKHSLNILCGGYAEDIHQIILSVSENKEELLSLLDKWDSLGDFEYRYLYKGLIRILYLHKSLEGDWKFALWNNDERKYEDIEKDKLWHLPHMYLYNIDKGVVLMIFKDYSEQIQLHYINKNLTDGGCSRKREKWQRYFEDWGGTYKNLFIEIDEIETWIDEAKQNL